MVLSTCNRVEVLAAGTGDMAEQILHSWAEVCHAKTADLKPYIYIYKNLEAVGHLFSVASSLDSMVLGEPQILGQLKAAYRNATKNHTSGIILNRLLHKAFSVAKRVRTETAVASNAVSISYAAVELAKRIFGDMKEHKAMLVGAGEMAELAAMHLLQAGIDEILVANRTLQRGRELAEQFHGRAVAFEQMIENLSQMDIVITSTGSHEPIIRAKDIRSVLRIRKNRPMFFIDIAVPRNIDPDVNGLDNVYLYDIDDLKEVVEENLANRKHEASKAHEIVDEEVHSFAHWLDCLDVQPTIIDLIERGERFGQEELAKTLKRLGPVSEETNDALLALVNALVRKLNHDPIMFLKSDGMGHDDSTTRINTVRRMFNLDKGTCIYSGNR
jgi:glutamyl-tRNA reductase